MTVNINAIRNAGMNGMPSFTITFLIFLYLINRSICCLDMPRSFGPVTYFFPIKTSLYIQSPSVSFDIGIDLIRQLSSIILMNSHK